jgi:peptidoglycan/xylan/chitin deacetylase (PgdA/CDA1 family)
MKISLTFDNGPDPEVTPQVLEALAAAKAPATFFAVGRLLNDRTLDLLRRARAEGHQVGNHTFHHAKPFGVLEPPLDAIDEIERTQALLEDLGAERLFRPTAGGEAPHDRLMTPTAYQHLLDGGYSCILWNNVPRDWADVEGWPETALAEARRRDWSVLVIHDIATGAMKQLPRFLDMAGAEGAEFTLDFPQACVPIRAGRAIWPMDSLMTRPKPDAAR